MLLVEDNPDVASASTGLLEQLGYTVRWVADAPKPRCRRSSATASTSCSATSSCRASMDGLGLARAIKQKHPALPILLATGYSEAAQKAGADFPILRKPYQIHELSRALG